MREEVTDLSSGTRHTVTPMASILSGISSIQCSKARNTINAKEGRGKREEGRGRGEGGEGRGEGGEVGKEEYHFGSVFLAVSTFVGPISCLHFAMAPVAARTITRIGDLYHKEKNGKREEDKEMRKRIRKYNEDMVLVRHT